jgi:hypothetical protein
MVNTDVYRNRLQTAALSGKNARKPLNVIGTFYVLVNFKENADSPSDLTFDEYHREGHRLSTPSNVTDANVDISGFLA